MTPIRIGYGRSIIYPTRSICFCSVRSMPDCQANADWRHLRRHTDLLGGCCCCVHISMFPLDTCRTRVVCYSVAQVCHTQQTNVCAVCSVLMRASVWRNQCETGTWHMVLCNEPHASMQNMQLYATQQAPAAAAVVPMSIIKVLSTRVCVRRTFCHTRPTII